MTTTDHRSAPIPGSELTGRIAGGIGAGGGSSASG